MPTTGWFSRMPPVEPWKPALPKLKMPPSEAASQYDEFGWIVAGPDGAGDGGPGTPAEPANAMTWLLAGARRSPSPTEGVGKWFAWLPTVSCSTVAPVEGLMP